MPSPSRRRLLQVGFTSTASLVGLAGCLDESTGVGDTSRSSQSDTATGTRTTTETSTGAESTRLLSWVPAPDSFPGVDRDFELVTADAAAIYERRDAFGGEPNGYPTFRRNVLGPISLLEPEPGTVDSVVQVQSGRLVLAATSTADADLETAFTDAGLTKDGTVSGQTKYTGSVDGTQLVCVAVDGVIVLTRNSESPAETIAAVLSAKHGEIPRYIERSDDLTTIRNALPARHFGVVTARDLNGSGVVESGTGFGYAWTFGPEETTIVAAVAYPEGEVPAESDFTSYLADQRGLRDYGEFTAETQGRVLIATGTIPTEDFDLLADGDPGERPTRGPRPPQIQFGFEYYPDEAEVRLRHEGGDEANAENLTVTLDGEETAAQWAQNYESVQAGDALTVDVSEAESGATLRIIWAEDSVSSMLARFTLP
ncbi:hypothetical protein [Haloarchaeobius sp. HME9146]|uniref:hypothetical protein n=1 Tax=Haloarchaeobius sp. HME9146 TaxID=2978732 RepID=UPI0021BF6AB3|nr:hypothetical protein [Haloarchaeobius sp. HME9146]MCT9096809.1 hypothetical protein [Haloarchaeobius sp. HME9146]